MYELRLASLFQDGCVLQQGENCKVWGSARPSAKITLEIQGHKMIVKAREDGNWMAELPFLSYSGEETLVVTDGKEQLICSHVAVGEVWLLGGQSNMEFYMRHDKDYPKEAEKADFPDICFFDYPEVSYPGQEEDFNYSRFGFWRRADRKSLEYFSAVGYYFADCLAKERKVPIGLISCNWGGTSMCAWLDAKKIPENGNVWLEEYEESIHSRRIGKKEDYILHPHWASDFDPENRQTYEEEYRKHPASDRGNPFADKNSDRLLYGISFQEQRELEKEIKNQKRKEDCSMFLGPFHQRRPGGLYETMVKKIAPYTVKGVLWYQGEGDSPHPECYMDMFRELVECWRTLWDKKLPFFCVQLAPFEKWLMCEGTAFPAIREAQDQVSREIEKVYLAASSDVGDRWDIHPKEKRRIGERLALLAEQYVYGAEIKGDSPRLKDAYKIENRYILEFSDTCGQLIGKGDLSKEFTIETKEKEKPEIYLEGNRIVFSFLKGVPASCRIAYCRKPYYEGNLYGQTGLPVLPFEVVF